MVAKKFIVLWFLTSCGLVDIIDVKEECAVCILRKDSGFYLEATGNIFFRNVNNYPPNHMASHIRRQ
jgi:hypothetical protein